MSQDPRLTNLNSAREVEAFWGGVFWQPGTDSGRAGVATESAFVLLGICRSHSHLVKTVDGGQNLPPPAMHRG